MTDRIHIPREQIDSKITALNDQLYETSSSSNAREKTLQGLKAYRELELLVEAIDIPPDSKIECINALKRTEEWIKQESRFTFLAAGSAAAAARLLDKVVKDELDSIVLATTEKIRFESPDSWQADLTAAAETRFREEAAQLERWYDEMERKAVVAELESFTKQVRKRSALIEIRSYYGAHEKLDALSKKLDALEASLLQSRNQKEEFKAIASELLDISFRFEDRDDEVTAISKLRTSGEKWWDQDPQVAIGEIRKAVDYFRDIVPFIEEEDAEWKKDLPQLVVAKEEEIRNKLEVPSQKDIENAKILLANCREFLQSVDGDESLTLEQLAERRESLNTLLANANLPPKASDLIELLRLMGQEMCETRSAFRDLIGLLQNAIERKLGVTMTNGEISENSSEIEE